MTAKSIDITDWVRDQVGTFSMLVYRTTYIHYILIENIFRRKNDKLFQSDSFKMLKR